jgi:hypothetical protein
MHSEWVFRLAGHTYTFDLQGNPQGRPNATECRRIIADDPMACAQFLHAYMGAFVAVMCGWSFSASKQVNPRCFFGIILALALKYEESTRGSKHAHGQMTQPALQAHRLVQLVTEGCADMQAMLHGFYESFAMCYWPSPSSFPPPEAKSGVQTFAPWVEQMPADKAGEVHLRMHAVLPSCLC